MLHEDLHDQETPMAIIGTDVDNLYPSLDNWKVVGEVKKAILDSEVKWYGTDYLEAAIYICGFELDRGPVHCSVEGCNKIINFFS